MSALGRTLRYHTGSLAFGAAIIAIVQFIRAVLEYVDHKLKGTNTPVVAYETI
jgi:choline transporter-like protein 2/4/5